MATDRKQDVNSTGWIDTHAEYDPHKTSAFVTLYAARTGSNQSVNLCSDLSAHLHDRLDKRGEGEGRRLRLPADACSFRKKFLNMAATREIDLPCSPRGSNFFE